MVQTEGKSAIRDVVRCYFLSFLKKKIASQKFWGSIWENIPTYKCTLV